MSWFLSDEMGPKGTTESPQGGEFESPGSLRTYVVRKEPQDWEGVAETDG